MIITTFFDLSGPEVIKDNGLVFAGPYWKIKLHFPMRKVKLSEGSSYEEVECLMDLGAWAPCIIATHGFSALLGQNSLGLYRGWESGLYLYKWQVDILLEQLKR